MYLSIELANLLTGFRCLPSASFYAQVPRWLIDWIDGFKKEKENFEKVERDLK